MKHLSYFLLLLLLGLPLLSACSDDSDTTPGADLPVPFAPLPANTLAGNQLNRGQATADADHLYYWTADTPTSIVLCSRHKETGMVIYLDHIEQAHEGVDFMFTNLARPEIPHKRPTKKRLSVFADSLFRSNGLRPYIWSILLK